MGDRVVVFGIASRKSALGRSTRQIHKCLSDRNTSYNWPGLIRDAVLQKYSPGRSLTKRDDHEEASLTAPDHSSLSVSQRREISLHQCGSPHGSYRAQPSLRRSHPLARRHRHDAGDRRGRAPARHRRARPSHRRQGRPRESEGAEADLAMSRRKKICDDGGSRRHRPRCILQRATNLLYPAIARLRSSYSSQPMRQMSSKCARCCSAVAGSPSTRWASPRCSWALRWRGLSISACW